MSAAVPPVQVVGGGIGGVTAALALARRGREVTVFEQADAFSEVGAGLQLGPNAMRVLGALGLDDLLAPHLAMPQEIVLRDGRSGRPIARVPMGEAARQRYGAPYAQVHRADLLEVVLRAAERQGVRFETGRRLLPGDTDAPLTVAADGVRSQFRARLNPGAQARFAGHVAWRALVPPDAAQGLSSDTHVFLGPERHLVAYALRGGTVWNVVAVEARDTAADESWTRDHDPAPLRAAFGGWCADVTRLLEAVETAYLWGLFGHPELARWQDGQTVLLGDACHPMLPFLAQGAAMAIEDAWVLASCLERAETQAAALARYEALRKPRATRVQAASSANAWRYHMAHPLLRLGRNTTLRIMQTVDPRALLRGLDWLYGEDVIAGGG